MKSKTYQITIIPVLVLFLILGTSHTLYQIKTTINHQIYGTPRGQIGAETPEDLDLPYEQIQFESEDGVILQGWFIDNTQTRKVVIIAPGRGANRWSVISAAPLLYEGGYDVLLFDPRTTGLSGGRKYGFGYFESIDLVNATKYLLEEKNCTEVAILGGSAGATAAILAATESDRIDAVIADSPYANLRRVVASQGEYGDDLALRFLFPLYMSLAQWSLGVDIYRETNALRKIQHLDTPVLFIHGKGDKILPWQHSQRLYENKKGVKEAWYPEQAGHVESYLKYPDEYSQKINKFLDQHM